MTKCHLRKAVKEYTERYHLERNHQGLDNELIERSSTGAALTAPSTVETGSVAS